MLEDFDHLYRYANLYELVEHRKAEKIVDGLTEVMPGRPTVAQHRHPYEHVNVHPAARQILHDEQVVVDARLREELDAKELLATLDRDGPNVPNFRHRLLVLRAAVLSHARNEELDEFPRLRQALRDPGKARLMPAVPAAEEVAPPSSQPGVATATENFPVGSLAAVINRTREVIRLAATRD